MKKLNKQAIEINNKTSMSDLVKVAKQFGVTYDKKTRKADLLALVVKAINAQKKEASKPASKPARKSIRRKLTETESHAAFSKLPIQPTQKEIDFAMKFFSDIHVPNPTQHQIDSIIEQNRKAINYGKSMPTKTEKSNRKNRASAGLAGNLGKHARTLLSLEFLNGISYVDPRYVSNDKLSKEDNELLSKVTIVELEEQQATIATESLRNISDYRAAQCSTHLSDFSRSYGSNGAHFLRFGVDPKVNGRNKTLTLTLMSESEQRQRLADSPFKSAIRSGKKSIDDLILVKASGSTLLEQIQLIREKYPNVSIVDEEQRTLMLSALADINTETCEEQANREKAARDSSK